MLEGGDGDDGECCAAEPMPKTHLVLALLQELRQAGTAIKSRLCASVEVTSTMRDWEAKGPRVSVIIVLHIATPPRTHN